MTTPAEQTKAAEDEALDFNRQGISFCKVANFTKAAECFRKAIRLSQHSYQYYLNLGNALNEMQMWEEAENVLGIAHSLSPNRTEIHKAIASTFIGRGQTRELIHRYRQAVAARPSDAPLIRNFCSVLLHLGEVSEATALARDLAAAAPNDVDACLLLASCFERGGRLTEATDVLLDALRYAPRHIPAAIHLGTMQARQARFEAAANTFENVLRISPDHLEAIRLLGVMRLYMGQVNSAISLLRRVIRAEPNSSEALRWLASAYVFRGSLEMALDTFRATLALDPGQNEIRSSYLYTLSLFPSSTRAEIFEAHQDWGRYHGAFPLPNCTNSVDPERKLKIGYLSPDFREHSVSYFIEPLLQAHDRSAFEVFCYADGLQFDATSSRLKNVCDHWRPIGTCDNTDAMKLIRNDGIDVLVDLAGHTAGNRLSLFVRGIAPVQISWLGYPETTGVPAIGYKITDAVVAPIGGDDNLFSETLLRIQNGHHCYRPPLDSPQVAPPPCLDSGQITFGCFADLPKINPSVVEVWAAILRRTIGSRLVIKCRQFADDAVSDKYRAMFEAAGVSSARVALMERSPTTLEHLKQYSNIDIALDTFPYNGTTTICEALWMGVPVVTMIGDRPASRIGASLLQEIGLPELIGSNADEFISIAAGLAWDKARLGALRSAMRDRLKSSPLCDDAAFARAIEAAYRTVWRRWCKNHPG